MRKLRNKLIILMVIITLVLTGCGGTKIISPSNQPNQTSDNNKEPYVIGFITDVTGLGATLGLQHQNTVKLIEKKINAEGGINGHPLKVILYDSQSEENQAVLVAKKLIETDKVLAIVGCASSGSGMAVSKITENAKIPFISTTSNDAIVTPVRPYTFKTPQSDILNIANLINNYIKPNNIKKIAWISVNDAYGDSGRVQFKKQAEANGLSIVVDEQFNASDTDVTPQLLKVRDAQPEAMVVWSRLPGAAIVNKKVREMGIKIPILQGAASASQDFIDQAGSSGEGVIVAAPNLLIVNELPDSHPQKKLLLSFTKDYKDAYGKDPAGFAGNAQSALSMIIDALKSGATTPDSIRNHLENKIKGFGAADGVFNYSPQDHQGLTLGDSTTVVIKGGKFSLYAK